MARISRKPWSFTWFKALGPSLEKRRTSPILSLPPPNLNLESTSDATFMSQNSVRKRVRVWKSSLWAFYYHRPEEKMLKRRHLLSKQFNLMFWSGEAFFASKRNKQQKSINWSRKSLQISPQENKRGTCLFEIAQND